MTIYSGKMFKLYIKHVNCTERFNFNLTPNVLSLLVSQLLSESYKWNQERNLMELTRVFRHPAAHKHCVQRAI